MPHDVAILNELLNCTSPKKIGVYPNRLNEFFFGTRPLTVSRKATSPNISFELSDVDAAIRIDINPPFSPLV
jgi:hypothetical protein